MAPQRCRTRRLRTGHAVHGARRVPHGSRLRNRHPCPHSPGLGHPLLPPLGKGPLAPAVPAASLDFGVGVVRAAAGVGVGAAAMLGAAAVGWWLAVPPNRLYCHVQQQQRAVGTAGSQQPRLQEVQQRRAWRGRERERGLQLRLRRRRGVQATYRQQCAKHNAWSRKCKLEHLSHARGIQCVTQ